MVFYIAVVCCFLLLNASVASAQRTPCVIPADCLQQSLVLSIIGITDFFTDNYAPSYGCFYEGDTAYFGLGGTVENMAESELEGDRNRIWCSGEDDGSSITTDGEGDITNDAESEMLVDIVMDTNEPTTQPTTARPTTAQPSKGPTEELTEEPSKDPSKKPTEQPSDQPTPRPSKKPTAVPTQQITFSPVLLELSSPTKGDITADVESEMLVDIVIDTNEPIAQPATARPTTAQPTKEPSKEPTEEPSKEPSKKPTEQPSDQPTPRPSKKPTAVPTQQITFSPVLLELSSPTTTACKTQKRCNLKRQELGYTKYYVGTFDTKGCYYLGDTAYFGQGGTTAERATDLSGDKGRIWCGDGNHGGSSDGGSANNQPPKVTTKSPVSSPITIDNEDIDFLLSIKPVNTPTNKPTIKTTTETPTVAPVKQYCIEINLTTDRFGGETGFYLTKDTSGNNGSSSSSEKYINYPIKSLESSKNYKERKCVPKGKYTFTIEDSFNGICCRSGKGSYSVSLEGEVIVSGGNFNTPTISHTILAGYEPKMTTDRDQKWLDGHNVRRKEFHERHGTSYRPLQWSEELAMDASNWVDEILPKCAFSRESGIGVGENMSVKRYNTGPRGNEEPIDILGRWSDQPDARNAGYPENQTMTQVMWRGTRYLGCSTKYLINDDGSYCYASICRYSRAGNCSMKSYDTWLDGVLQDRTNCGTACPAAGCY